MKRVISVIISIAIIFTNFNIVKVRASNIPVLQILKQPAKEYKNNETISFDVQAPNYSGKVEYRVILYNGTTKKTTNLWNTPNTGYYYRNWQPAGTYKFTIKWSASQLEPGPYSMTVLVRRANSKSQYESHIDTSSFWVTGNDNAEQAMRDAIRQEFKNGNYLYLDSYDTLKSYIQSSLDEYKDKAYILIPRSFPGFNPTYTVEGAKPFRDFVRNIVNSNDYFRQQCFIQGLSFGFIPGDVNIEAVVEFNYKYPHDELMAINKQVDEKIDQIINSIITPSMTDYDKVLAIHDYVINNTTYDITANESSKNVYGPLILGKAVSKGYVAAMIALLKKVGIESIPILNTEKTHNWNLVKLDGDYYHLDATWDDYVTSTGENKPKHDYFLLTDDEMSSKHTWKYDEYPKAAGTKY